MIKAKKYESYKSSNIDFIGDIPKHWEVKKLKFIVDKIMGGGTPLTSKSDYWTENKDDGLLWVAIADITKSEYIENTKKYITEEGLNNSSAQRVEAYSVLYSIYASLGKVAYSQYELTTNQAILAIKPNEELFYKFLFYYLQTVEDKLPFLSSSTTQNNISLDVVKNFDITLPPYTEQEIIAKFLDTKNQQIEEFIKEKQKQIALLEEQKEAIINKAVTKGLDETVELKDSGIEWIGDIPKHWSIRKLKYCVIEKLRYGANESAELDNIDYPRYIRITDFGYDGKLRDDTFRSLHPDVAKNYLLAEGDILFARSGATVGKTFQFKNYNGQACFAGYLIKATVDTSIMYSDFLFLFTKSLAYSKWKDFIFNKATIENIGADKYNELQLTLPSLIEQKAIVKYTETEQLKIDKVINQIQKEIKLIEEYKISLISEVVTGQIDVR